MLKPASAPSVLVVLPPAEWDDVHAAGMGRFTELPALAVHVDAALRQAGLETTVLHFDRRYHGSYIGLRDIEGALSAALSDPGLRGIVMLISHTESYNEFSNTDPGLLRRMIALPALRGRKLVVCGRVLSEAALRREVPGEYVVVPVSYDEGRAVVAAMVGGGSGSERRLQPWDDEAAERYSFDELFARRDADHPVVLVGQRGCPYACTFCERVLIWPGHDVVRGDPRGIAEAMRFFRDRYGRRHFVILDPIFPLDDSYVAEFCRAVAPLGVRWHAELRAERARLDTLRRMHDAGCYRVLLGVESLDPQVSAAVRKPMRLELVQGAVEACRSAGIQSWSSFILGLGRSVREAYRSVRVSAQLVRRHGLGWAHGVPYFLYEGTREYVSRFGRSEEGPYPRWYHPFPLPVMADLTVLFRNIIDGVDSVGSLCLLDLAREAVRSPSWEVPDGLIEALGRQAGRGALLKAMLRANAGGAAGLCRELVEAWESDAAPGRYALAEEATRLSVGLSAVQPWP